MLQLPRLMQCAMVAASASSVFASARALGSGRLARRKAFASVTAGESGVDGNGGNDDVEDVGDTRSDPFGGAGPNSRVQFDFAGYEADLGDAAVLPLPLPLPQPLPPSHNNSHHQHRQQRPQRRGAAPRPSSPPSSSSLRRPPAEAQRPADAGRLVDAAQRRRQERADDDAADAGEEEETASDYAAAAAAAAPNGHALQRRPGNDGAAAGGWRDNSGDNANPPVPAGLTNPFLGLHDHITRSYRLDQLLAVARPEDVLIGRQETKSGAFSFIRFETGPQFLAHNAKSSSTPQSDAVAHDDCALVVAERLLAFPPHMRHFHSVCGRENVPCDFFADVDLPNETPASGEKLLMEMLNYLEVRLQGIGFHQPSFLVLTNEVPSAEKVSYHVHARSMGAPDEAAAAAADDDDGDDAAAGNAEAAGSGLSQRKRGRREAAAVAKKKPKPKKIIAFQDYRVVKLLAEEVNTTLGRTVVDDQCYRTNGMLRCAFSSKIVPSPSGGVVRPKGKRLIPMLKAQDTALQRRLNDMAAYLHTLSDAEILERTFGTRSAPVTESHRADTVKDASRRFKLLRARHVLGPRESQAVEFDAYGNAVSVYLTEGAKWRRFKAVIDKLRRMPPRSAESYDVWVRVGLALHNFSNEDHVFEEWVRFSLKCPQKYSRESCRKKWQQFERNPDALNWRRGFNYLNTTVWRSVQRE
ncbi:DNA repair protein RAD50 [Trypanosoma conorhini]|uniref:DNA repair protein RAD50 n=1 Tax=Trypanosoma conorhini TaxID=83891 RepID=A0A3R7N9R6_9TRYP|nr:DNA repair protein RAD50 [Trypanosoma conorhini]RNF18732.1 DNA repair protein RAD50 [Trypanosoma conorhini]